MSTGWTKEGVSVVEGEVSVQESFGGSAEFNLVEAMEEKMVAGGEEDRGGVGR